MLALCKSPCIIALPDVASLRGPLLASLIVHALMIMPPVVLHQSVSLSPPLSVRLVPMPQVSSAPPAPAALADAVTARQGQWSRPAQPVTRREAPASTSLAHAPPAFQARPATAVLESAEGEIDGEALRAYKLGVAVSLSRLVAANAAPASSDGQVTVSVTLGAFGAFGGGPRVNITASSGNAALDDEARRLVARALEIQRIPDPLRGRMAAFELPITFGALRP